MKSNIRKVILILSTVLLMATLCGCDLFTQINLTDEQSSLIAEYAAGLLKKYDTNGKLKDIVEEKAEKLEETPEETPEGAVEEEQEEPVEETATVDTVDASVEPDFYDITEGMEVVDAGSESVGAGEIETSNSSIADLLGVSGCDITYSGYELCDQYPDNGDNSWVISMAARDGKKLCVLKFNIANNSGEEMICNILNSGKSYRLIVNDDKRINETVTVLMDSFSQFNEKLDAGDSREAVLIFEPDTELAESINSLKLIIKDKDNSDTISLE